MKEFIVEKNGFKLRALKCDKCKNQLLHPQDLKEFEDFQIIKRKQFHVKLRFVGNSYAVSIPREIIDFMQDSEKRMNDMVNLCFEEMGRISLNF